MSEEIDRAIVEALIDDPVRLVETLLKDPNKDVSPRVADLENRMILLEAAVMSLILENASDDAKQDAKDQLLENLKEADE